VTTLALLVTPGGIALGADSKVTPRGNPVPVLDPDWQDGVKIKLVQNHIGVAAVHTGYCIVGNRTIYDFHAWIREIEGALRENISVVDFAAQFNSRFDDAFSPSYQLLGDMFSREIANGQPLFAFLICGYDDGCPKAYEVTVRWDGGIQVLQCELVVTQGFLCHPAGQCSRITEALRGSGDSYDKVIAWASGLSTFLKRGNLAADEASFVCAGLIALEAESQPEAVGPPFRVLTFIPGRPAIVNIYSVRDQFCSRSE
jgi:hypothetical protein